MRTAGYLAGLAATSHDSSAPPTTMATFDNVSVSVTGNWNLLADGGFEDDMPPALSLPGWVSDNFRQTPARSETAAPHGGAKNGACRTTTSADCGMFQDLKIPMTGSYQFQVYIAADHSGGLVGLNLNGSSNRRIGDGEHHRRRLQAVQHRILRDEPAMPSECGSMLRRSAGAIVVDDSSLTRSASE